MKSPNLLVVILIVAGMFLTIILNMLSLLNCWELIGYADWEFQPFLYKPVVAEAFHSVRINLLVYMQVTIVFVVCVLFFLIMILRWKKYGFWGYVIVSVVATIIKAILLLRVMKAFRLINVDTPSNVPLQIAWTFITIALLFGILQIRKNGVSFWKQLG